MNSLRKLAGATTLCLLAGSASADTVLGIYAGAGVWQADLSGQAGNSLIDVDQLGLDDDNANFVYVALEHPIPLIPNLRLQQTQLDTSGSGELDADFKLDDVVFSGSSDVHSELQLDHTDVVLYYELLDNWVNLDLGLNVRNLDGELTVAGGGEKESVELSGWLPMLYAKAQFDLPTTGWSLAAEASGIGYSGDGLLDYTVKIAYESDLIPFLGLGLEAGYRSMTLDLEELDDLRTDLEVKGPYAAVTMHF